MKAKAGALWMKPVEGVEEEVEVEGACEGGGVVEVEVT